MSLQAKINHLLLFALSAMASFSLYSKEISGAACIIRFDDKMVFIQEILTNKLSIPAGGMLEGETPEMTARRETYEETGLLVKPTNELGRSQTTVFFDCLPTGKVQALKQKNRYQGHNLQTWKAPHYGVEVNLAMIADPLTIVGSEYRFPHQLQWLKKMFKRASNNRIVFVPLLSTSRSFVDDIQVSYFNKITQHYFSFSQTPQYTVKILSVLGKLLNSPIFILLALVWVFKKADYQSGQKLLIFTVALNILVLLLQRWLGSPSPNIFSFNYLADTKSWFSLPSSALVNWSFLSLVVNNFLTNRRRSTLWFALSFFLLNMSVLLLEGSVFLTDGLISILIGVVAYLGFKRWCRYKSTYLKKNTRLCLMLLAISCFILALVWPLVSLFSLTATLIMLIVISFFVPARVYGKCLNSSFYITLCAVMFVDFLLTVIFHFFVSRGEAIVALDIIRYPVAVLLLYRQFMFEDKEEKGNKTSDEAIL